ncbi:anti-sigma regulatory factor (Ser/Thr protein kinase) [Saccharothrix australiensis]|uniref:Anti-sigma regulatory factor (Ser/Thr protein kinase) n=1 Tax=Saccharothrix australiensis TaxID=2072 RepID=A0A495W5B5_9PSEU|nr:anti-sigma regulatory factor (Ser/Thr protein kinase) [Saccharothrix australiensis]
MNLVAEYSPPGGAGSAGLAREFTRRTLAAWGYLGAHDDVVLAVSELVANAARHAGGTSTVRLAGGAGRVRVEVADDSPVRPHLRPQGTDGGWGLPLIDRLARCWGVVAHGHGKVVWCELA